ncbi:MAG: enoyl-CoA hydratase/isomerase family protein [Bacteroidota bacterium]
MDYQHIRFERQDKVAWITLYRPEKMNALTDIMIAEWRQVLDQLAEDESCSVVVVKGEGRAWSAGVDLSIFQHSKVERGFEMWEDGMKIMHHLEHMPQVTIAMLNGHCFTGAMELMLAFDLVLAADEAKIGDTHAKWGIAPKWGMTQRLQKLVGLRKAKELSFTAQPISGQEAARIGLVNASVPAAELPAAVDQLLAGILQNSSQALAGIKHVYQYGAAHTLDEGLKYEIDYQMKLTDKADELKNFKKNI